MPLVYLVSQVHQEHLVKGGHLVGQVHKVSQEVQDHLVHQEKVEHPVKLEIKAYLGLLVSVETQVKLVLQANQES